MEERFITITGVNHYFGTRPFQPGTLVLLIKEPENPHDGEAIRVELPIVGKAGYVANSPYTVVSGTHSAGRVYDTFGGACFARVMFLADSKIIARLDYSMVECVFVTKMSVGDAAPYEESAETDHRYKQEFAEPPL